MESVRHKAHLVIFLQCGFDSCSCPYLKLEDLHVTQ